MTTQPRQPKGSRRNSRGVAGQWTSKQAPDVTNEPFGFNATVAEPNDWDRRSVKVWGLRTVFTRAVETGADGEKVVSVTTNCDSPDMLLLARKNDVGYWSYAAWSEHDTDRRTWSAEITRRMLQDGHVATGYAADVLGVCAAMTAASNHRQGNWKHGPHVLTGGVAQIRGLRLLQSMAGGSADWWTTLGGYPIPADVNDLLCERFNDAARVYEKLPKPPWRDDVAWGPQDVAGHAVTYNDKPMFCW